MTEDRFCICVLKSFVDKGPFDIRFVSLEFVFSFIICLVGIFLNRKFLKDLEDEKRRKPLNRKGNVIEPIMRWFCKLQLVFWPFQQFIVWSVSNDIISIDTMPNWCCIMLTSVVIIARCIIGYNSLFVALIRFIYIVYDKKANQWNFQTVGSCFQIASIVIPFLITAVMIFTLDPSIPDKRFSIYSHCPLIYASSDNINPLKPVTYQLTMKVLPKQLVTTLGIISATIQAIILSNLVEGVLYIIIFKHMKR